MDSELIFSVSFLFHMLCWVCVLCSVEPFRVQMVQ